MVLNLRELPQKESFKMFLELKRKCKLLGSQLRQLHTALDMDDQEAQLFLQMETPPHKALPQTRKGEVLQ